jgi:hypothetical protein
MTHSHQIGGSGLITFTLFPDTSRAPATHSFAGSFAGPGAREPLPERTGHTDSIG